MSMFTIEPSNLSLSLTLGLTLCLSGCQILPKQPHLPESQALSARVEALYQQDNKKSDRVQIKRLDNGTSITNSNTDSIDLVAAISEQNDIHPDLSGYHPIVTGANAFASRSILTGMATRNIDAQYYIWHDDQAGQLMLKDLWDAAERGVIVRLLLDDFNNNAKFDQHLLRFSSHPNIAVRIINPLMYRKFQTLNYLTGLPRINRRMHNKSMIFDKQITIIGGRNIGDEYLSNDKNSQFADLDVLLIGKVVADIDNSFADYWSAPISFDIETLAKLDKGETTDFLEGLDKLRADEKNNNKSSLAIYKTAIDDSSIDTDLINKRVPFRWTDMQFLSDDVGKLTKTVPADTNLVHQLRTLLGSPSKKLTIISSYFVPTKDGVNTLVELAESGIDIKILTNSFDATDVTAVHSGYSQWRPSLLRAGVKIYELKATAGEEKRENKLWKARSQSSTSLHAKAFAVDDYQVFIGSYNVDPRSANINTEMGVIINDDQLATQLHDALSDDLLSQAYEVKLQDNGNLQWHTIEDNKKVIYDSEPRVDVSDHVWLTIMSWLPIDWLL
ncbi:phospholipase D family protein [Psychrobacter sp. DAB_AL43B]|uniref:phospholipase D family protein n=1 Tax=Psychrobacter sp. DAB_AL43B TaxID=1028416 RepID=UPI0009A75F06|nr:phospholipase D family protein [Psychrobacter sp. DAB_AL43B]SLJ84151.1 phospholipase D/transphosphatidylase [Psychrobacter sp. DAB_AL43B]